MTFLTANLHVGLLIAHSYVAPERAIRACGCIVTGYRYNQQTQNETEHFVRQTCAL